MTKRINRWLYVPNSEYKSFMQRVKGKTVKAMAFPGSKLYSNHIPFVKVGSDGWPDTEMNGDFDLGTMNIWHNVLFSYDCSKLDFGAELDGKIKDIYFLKTNDQPVNEENFIASYYLVSTERGDAFVDTRYVA